MFKSQILAFVGALLFLQPMTHAQELRKMRSAIIGPSMSFLPLYVAGKRGYFKEHRIDNEIVVIRSSASQIQALISGSVQTSLQAPAPLMRAVEKGIDLTLIAGMVAAPTYDLVAGKQFKSIEALRGTTIAVSGISDSITVPLQEMLLAHKLTYPKDYNLVQVGGTPDRMAALERGSVSAALIDPPRNFIAKDRGFSILAHMKDYIPHLQFTSLSVSREWATKNAPLLEDYMVAILKANRYIYENKAGTQAIIQDTLKYKTEYVERVYDYWIGNKVLPLDGAVSIKGTEAMIAIMDKLGDFQGSARPKAEKYIDTSYLTKARARLGN